MRTEILSRRVVVLSPHLDDAILSCGGLLSALSGKCAIEVWTVFTEAPSLGPYSPLAKWLHQASGGISGSRLFKKRRQEDRNACEFLSVKHRHFGWHDAAYRKRWWKGFLYSSGRNLVWHRADTPLIARITTQLQTLLDADDLLFIPLGVGKHIDHLIAREAADNTHHPKVCYYADVPYTQLFATDIEEFAAGMELILEKVSQKDVSNWVEAARRYTSQIPMLEIAVGPIEQVIEREARGGAVRFYLPRQWPGHRTLISDRLTTRAK